MGKRRISFKSTKHLSWRDNEEQCGCEPAVGFIVRQHGRVGRAVRIDREERDWRNRRPLARCGAESNGSRSDRQRWHSSPAQARGIRLAAALGLARMGAQVIVNGRPSRRLPRPSPRSRARCRRPKRKRVLTSARARELRGAHCPLRRRYCVGPTSRSSLRHPGRRSWHRMFEVNVMSGVRLTRHYLEGMLEEKKWGRVVFVSNEVGHLYPVSEMVHHGFSRRRSVVIARGAAMTRAPASPSIPYCRDRRGSRWRPRATTLARARGLGTTADDRQPAPSPSAGRLRCCSATRRLRIATSSATSARKPPAPPTAPRAARRRRHRHQPVLGWPLMWALTVAVICFGVVHSPSGSLQRGLVPCGRPMDQSGADPWRTFSRRKHGPQSRRKRSVFLLGAWREEG